MSTEAPPTPKHWTEHPRRTYGPSGGPELQSLSYGTADAAEALVSEERRGYWLVYIYARKDERVIDFRGTAEEVQSFAQVLCDWYERRTT